MEKSALVIPLIGQEIRTREYLGLEKGKHQFLLNKGKVLCKVDESLTKVTFQDVEKDSEYRKKFSWRAQRDLEIEQRVTVSASSNDENTGVSVVSEVEKKMYKSSTVSVFDKDDKVVWKTKISPRFNNDSFGFLDVTVSNDGKTVYLLAKSLNPKNEKNANTTLHLFKITGDGIDETTSEAIVDADYHDATLKILSNGNIFVGGYRCEPGKKDVRILKSFSLMFDGKDLEKLNAHVSDYSKFVPEKNMKNPTHYFNGYARTIIKGVYEMADGNVVMLAEESSLMNGYQGYSSVFYAFRNIYIDTYTLDGEVVNTDILYKSQYISSGSEYPENALPLSFDVVQLKNELVLVYNDNVKNLAANNVDNVKKDFDIKKNAKKTVATMCSITDGKVGKKKALIDSKTEKRFFLKILKQYDNYALVYTQSKNFVKGSLMLEKITW
jgi:hypothetical protein